MIEIELKNAEVVCKRKNWCYSHNQPSVRIKQDVLTVAAKTFETDESSKEWLIIDCATENKNIEQIIKTLKTEEKVNVTGYLTNVWDSHITTYETETSKVKMRTLEKPAIAIRLMITDIKVINKKGFG